MRYSDDSLAEVEADNVSHQPTYLCVSFQKAITLVKHDLPLVNPCWLLPITFLSSM